MRGRLARDQLMKHSITQECLRVESTELHHTERRTYMIALSGRRHSMCVCVWVWVCGCVAIRWGDRRAGGRTRSASAACGGSTRRPTARPSTACATRPPPPPLQHAHALRHILLLEQPTHYCIIYLLGGKTSRYFYIKLKLTLPDQTTMVDQDYIYISFVSLI